VLQSNIYNNIKEAIDSKNYFYAADLSRKYLANGKDVHVLVIMVLSLYKINRFSEAQQAIMDDPNAFTGSLTDFMLMINVLLHNQEFIKSREMVYAFNGINMDYFSCGMQAIKKSENEVRQHDKNDIQKRARQYYNLSAKKTLFAQKKIFLMGQRLPYEIFVEYSQFVLLDPFVHQVVKSEIVDTLRKINYRGKIPIYWINRKNETIDFLHLPSLESMKSYQYLIRRVRHDFSDNPEKMSLIYNYFYHQSMIMYPFNDRVIKDCENWYFLTLQEYLQTKNYQCSDNNGYLKYIVNIKQNFISIK
jgi:hypothetical protein